MRPGLGHYLVVAAILFALGLFTVMTRKNAVGMLLGMELILNAAALDFVAFNHFVAEPRGPAGEVFALFIVALAAAEAVIALAVTLQVYRSRKSIAVDELTQLRR